jgi:hypothetical protein
MTGVVPSDDSLVDTPPSEKLDAFLDQAGSIELIILVGEEMQYSEISDRIRVADSTMNKRRAQAVTLGLIRGNTTFEEDGTDRTEYYELTPLGKAIR